MVESPEPAVHAPVIICGAGPVGLTLALGLARHGIRSVILEKKRALDVHSRALVVLPRTLEALDAYGIAQDFLKEGVLVQNLVLHDVDLRRPLVYLPFAELNSESSYAGMLLLPQDGVEQILLEHVRRSGLGEVLFSHELISFEQDSEGIEVAYKDDKGVQRIRSASFLAGCDGAKSTVRSVSGWQLEGITYPVQAFLCDIRITDERDASSFPRVSFRAPCGMVGAIRYKPGCWRLLGSAASNDEDDSAIDPLRIDQHVNHLFGAGPYERLWAGVFRIHRRISPTFREGRILILGDAAHISSPAGGQGMNSGIQDAHNLAWKLALVLNGGDPERLLTSYERERRSAVEFNVMPFTDLATRFMLATQRRLGNLPIRAVGLIVRTRFFRRRLLMQMSMFRTRYSSSPLLVGPRHRIGRRAPGGLFDRSTLLVFGAGQEFIADIQDGTSRRFSRLALEIAIVDVQPDSSIWHQWKGKKRLVVFVRPDGYVGWEAVAPSVEQAVTGMATALGLS